LHNPLGQGMAILSHRDSICGPAARSAPPLACDFLHPLRTCPTPATPAPPCFSPRILVTERGRLKRYGFTVACRSRLRVHRAHAVPPLSGSVTLCQHFAIVRLPWPLRHGSPAKGVLQQQGRWSRVDHFRLADIAGGPCQQSLVGTPGQGCRRAIFTRGATLHPGRFRAAAPCQ
jgi:hypothetical protein